MPVSFRSLSLFIVYLTLSVAFSRVAEYMGPYGYGYGCYHLRTLKKKVISTAPVPIPLVNGISAGPACRPGPSGRGAYLYGRCLFGLARRRLGWCLSTFSSWCTDYGVLVSFLPSLGVLLTAQPRAAGPPVQPPMDGRTTSRQAAL